MSRSCRPEPQGAGKERPMARAQATVLATSETTCANLRGDDRNDDARDVK
jgi:hypothetical protein